MLVAGNKCDLAEEEQVADFRRFVEELGIRKTAGAWH